MISKEHTPVLSTALLDLLQLEPNHTVVDLTLGRSGHAFEVWKRLNVDGMFIGFDADHRQIAHGKEVFQAAKNVQLVEKNFTEITKGLKDLGISCANSIYADLGLSTVQLLDPTRGFSFQSDQALDMRLSETTQSLSAKDIVNTFPEKDMADIFFQLGEERMSRQIAAAIVADRKIKPFENGMELAELIAHVKRVRGKIHPATQVFQALRMYVNDELGTLKTMLQQIPQLLCENGRFAIITFHSLEDRIVKNTFKQWKQEGTMEIINKKVIKPTWEEMKANPRARSAHLRVVKSLKVIGKS